LANIVDHVVQYWSEFLKRMADYEKRMIKFSAEQMELEQLPELDNGMLRIVLVTRDKSAFSSHDGRNTMWMGQDAKPSEVRRTKLDDFGIHERLSWTLKLSATQLTNNPGVSGESLIILRPGKNGDGWWRNSNLVKQLQEKAISIFQILHPDPIGLFMFTKSPCVAPRCVAFVHAESQ
jgi:hypothetical protein